MIPDWLRDKLASPPVAGAGIHAWLFSTARQLHAHMPAEAIIAALQATTANAGRHVPLREIRDAVVNSHAIQWQPSGAAGVRGGRPIARGALGGGAPQLASAPDSCRQERWPHRDDVARRCRIADAAAEGIGGLVDLWERSPARPEMSADDWLDWLFPGAEWLCLADDHPATARTRRREKWSFGAADQCGLVVPSPMTGPGGRGLDGRQSHRCLDNTGPRRWLVIEFDSGTADEQAALHWHLGGTWPLVLCVHSAGKSIHGWYGPLMSEPDARACMEYAVHLGADYATWNRCQLVRLPGGSRRGQRLEVFFFDPSPCKTLLSSNYSGLGGLADSTQRRESMAA